MRIKCNKCGFENPEGFFFCGKCGSKLIKKRKAERKRVSVMFVDIAGFTPLSEKKDSEEIVKILNLFFSEVEKIVKKYDGVVDKYIGDAALCFFGVKGKYENHAEKAIKAGIDIINLVNSKKIPYRIGVHVGINSGEILLTGIGTDRVLDYTVIGDTVNLAQRIESLSGFNEVLVSESTKELAKDIFIFESIGKKKVKGRESKVNVYRVKGIREERKRIYEFPFVGRKEIIKKLIDEIEKNKGIKVFILEGVPGVGKTRILNEIIEREKSKFSLFSFRALPFSGSFNILSEKIKKKFKIEKRLFGKGWIRFIEYVEKKGKAIFILDDMQWADFLSYEFIKFLISRLKIPAVFIISTRDKDIPARRLKGISLEFIEVEPFSYEEYREFIDRIRPNIPMYLEEEIFKKSNGTPLFIEEILKTKGDKIPDRIDSIIMSDIEKLERNLQEKIKMISVLGPSFEDKFLKILDLNPHELKELLDKDYLLKEGNRYFFKTPLLQEVIYDTLLKEERREIHRRIYRNLKKRYDLTSLFHAYKGELFEQVIKYGERVLNKLLKEGSISDVKIATEFIISAHNLLNREIPESIWYRRALSLLYLGFLEEAKKLVRNLKKGSITHYQLLSLYYKFKGEKKKSINVLKRGIGYIRGKRDRLKLYLIMADILLDAGEFKKGLEILEKIKKEGGVFDEEDKLKFMNLYQTALENTGKYEESLEICYKLYQHRQKLSLREIANLEYSIAFNKSMLGDYKDAEKFFKNAIKDYEFLREYTFLSPVLLEYSYLLYTRGRYEESLGYIKRAREIANKIGIVEDIAKADAYEGLVYLARGEIRESERFLKKTMQTFKIEKFNKALYLTILHNYANLLTYKGKFKESISYFKKLIKMAKEEKDKFLENLNFYALSLAYFLSGNISKALFYIKKPLDYSKREKIPVFIFRNLALLYKIKVLKGEKDFNILKEMKKIAETSGRKDLYYLHKFYEKWSWTRDSKVLEKALEKFKKEIKFHTYLIEKYSLSLLNN